jgi:hypothetical protein
MESSLESIILEQLTLHRGYAVQDLYKLVYQAVFGVEHFLKEEKEAYRRLSEEFGGLKDVLPGERLFELIDPKGMVHRVNLRPYKTGGGELDVLFETFLSTRGEVAGTRTDFTCLWREAAQLTERLSLPFSLGEIRRLELRLRNGDLPILHHSGRYAELNQPSYRLIVAPHLQKLSSVE